jgi:hypothetical protein
MNTSPHIKEAMTVEGNMFSPPELKKDISAGIEDPLVDITSFEDKTLDEGYGTGGDRPAGVQSGNIVHQNMIKRYAEGDGTSALNWFCF